MRKTKKILSILLAGMILMSLLSVGVFAAGTQDDPIDAKTKWFGYGVDTYLLNPTIAEGSDGLWYTLTAENAGILSLEHSYKNVDYTICVTLNGVTYEGGCVDGEPYNRPIVTAPVRVGDVATIRVATKDAAAGTVYASMNVIAGDIDDPVKVKSDGLSVVVGAGESVYFQDDSLNAIYATKGLLVEGNASDVTFYAVTKNSESGAVSKKAFTDTDADGIIEATLGGSLGSAGAPPVKPAWAIENASNEDRVFTLTIVEKAHECIYDNDTDADCNSCGASRDLACDHAYDHAFATLCNLCGEPREVELPLSLAGNSISEDVDGLAWMVKANVDGVKLDKTTANYENATVNGYKLVRMGAVVSNNSTLLGHVPNLDDVDGVYTLDIEAKYICEEDKAAGTVSYAVRVKDIPDEYKDHEICLLPYIIFQDEAGVEHTLYGDSASAAYNWFA